MPDQTMFYRQAVQPDFSPLNTNDFIKKTSLINYTQEDLAGCWQDIAAFADSEQLPAHADAIRVRFDDDRYGNRE